MLAKYEELGCGAYDVACLCRAPNFNYGVHDCAMAACKSDEASTVISFETSYYCPHYMATGTNSPTHAPTPTAISDLPACGVSHFPFSVKQGQNTGLLTWTFHSKLA